jgi:hypothetical protein
MDSSDLFRLRSSDDDDDDDDDEDDPDGGMVGQAPRES